MVGTYIQKPIIFEAIQYDGTNVKEIQDWCLKHIEEYTGGSIGVSTLHGVEEAFEGVYIARTNSGDLRVYPKERFEKEFSPIEVRYEVKQ